MPLPRQTRSGILSALPIKSRRRRERRGIEHRYGPHCGTAVSYQSKARRGQPADFDVPVGSIIPALVRCEG